jgi:hypothetical protein
MVLVCNAFREIKRGRIKSAFNGQLLHVRKLYNVIVVFWNMATVSCVDTDVSEEAAYPISDCYISKAAVFVIT